MSRGALLAVALVAFIGGVTFFFGVREGIRTGCPGPILCAPASVR